MDRKVAEQHEYEENPCIGRCDGFRSVYDKPIRKRRVKEFMRGEL